MPRQYTHTELHPSGRVDPSKTRIICEGPDCTNEILMSEAHSIVALSYAMRTAPDGTPLPAFQCPEEQHFCCSPACMIAASTACMREHLLPVHTAQVAHLREETRQP